MVSSIGSNGPIRKIKSTDSEINLPTEVLTKIVVLISSTDADRPKMGSLRLVNHQWKLAVDQIVTQAEISETFSLHKLVKFKYLQSLKIYCDPPHGKFNMENPWGTSGSFLKNAHLLSLDNFINLRHLCLEDHRCLTNDALVPIGQQTQLQTLNLHNCVKVNGMGLRHLANLRDLKILRLTGDSILKPIARQDLESLAQLPSLHTFELSQCSGKQLNSLVELLSGKIKRISALKIEEVGAFSLLAKLPNLTELALLPSAMHDSVLAELSQLTQLRSLDLSSCDVKDMGRKALESLINLLDLKIKDAGDKKFLSHLTQLTRLTAGFSESQISCCRSLSRLTNLKILNLIQAHFKENFSWSSLSHLTALRANFSFFTSKGAESIKSMTNLSILDLSHTFFPSGFDIDYFGDLQALQQLRWNEIKTLNSLGLMQRLPPNCKVPLSNLKYLSLRGSETIDKDHRFIEKIPNLTELDIGETAYLSLFETYFRFVKPDLKIYPSDAIELSFWGSIISQKRLQYLYALPKLEKLDLSGAFFRAEDYAALRTQLPNLKIYPNQVIHQVYEANIRGSPKEGHEIEVLPNHFAH